MAPISYYYLVSVILFAGALLFIVNMIYLRRVGRTTFGQEYPVGKADHKSIVKKLANRRNLGIATILALILFANLLWSALLVLRLGTADSIFLLAFAPVLVAGLFALTSSKVRKHHAK